MSVEQGMGKAARRGVIDFWQKEPSMRVQDKLQGLLHAGVAVSPRVNSLIAERVFGTVKERKETAGSGWLSREGLLTMVSEPSSPEFLVKLFDETPPELKYQVLGDYMTQWQGAGFISVQTSPFMTAALYASLLAAAGGSSARPTQTYPQAYAVCGCNSRPVS